VPVSSDGGFSYKLHIDDVKINLRYRLAKKICKRVDYLLNKPDIDKEEEHSNFIKKDAHINFAKRK
jgi:hypothetical protein